MSPLQTGLHLGTTA